MDSIATHSPTPWELVEGNEYHGPYICSNFGTSLCDLYVMSTPSSLSARNGGNSEPIPFVDADENAAHIVKCVNVHDELVAALKAAYCHLAQPYAGTPDAREMVRKAIAKAEQST